VRRALPALALLAAASLARGDASITPSAAGAARVTFAGRVVDLDGARVITDGDGQCAYPRWRFSDEAPRAQAERLRPPGGGERMNPVQLTAHHVLFGTFWGRNKGRGVVVERPSGKVVWRGGEALAMTELPDGTLDGVLVLAPDERTIAWSGADGKERWHAKNEPYSGDGAEVLVDGDRLIVLLYQQISCGTSLLAFDRATGAIVWKADVDQIMVGHSKYLHSASIALRGRNVVLTDLQSGGCSLQLFDRVTGARRLSVKKQGW
jgi:hypothetical protein